MNAKELSVSNVVEELVKNSIDAQCNLIQVEFSGLFDIRVIDDGCGFDESTMQSIGERQVIPLHALQKNRFRYGKHGKSLLAIAQATYEMFMESIKQNSDTRLYKTIAAGESKFKVYETTRNYKDAEIKTVQGSMVYARKICVTWCTLSFVSLFRWVVLNTLRLKVGDAGQVRSSIVSSIVELALINFEVEMSVKDTNSQQTLYDSHRTKNLFDKFEQFLESQRFFLRMQSVSCEKHDVKVELFLCEIGTSNKAFQFVYFNKLIESDGKWRRFVNKLLKKRFEKDLNAKHPVYLLNISVEKYHENQLAYNVIIDNCIRKCFEQLSQPTTTKASVSNTAVSNHEAVVVSDQGNKKINSIESTTKRESEIRLKCEEISKSTVTPEANADKGVRLGDWIFNNSCEDYQKLQLDREVYRKKICENWVISLEKPKPKDADDSLNSVAINKSTIPHDSHLFKKPKPKLRQEKHKPKPKIISKSLLPHVSSQIYKPSSHVRAFNNSSLIRASKKLILKTSTDKSERFLRIIES